MFDTQTGQYSGLLRRYVVQQITALTNPASAERLTELSADGEAEKLDLRSRAFSEVLAWSVQTRKRPSSFLPRQSFLTSLGIRQLYSGLRQDSRVEWMESLLTNARLLHSVTSAFSSALRNATTLPKVSVSGARPLPRAYAAVRAYLSGVGDAFRQDSFIVFINAIQEHVTFDIDELWLLKPLLQLRLMQRLIQIGSERDYALDREGLQRLSTELKNVLKSLRELDHSDWTASSRI